jgi:nitrite reductase (cytochrome c-552)
MPDTTPPRRRWLYPVTLLTTAGVTVAVTALLMNINRHKQEARETHFRIVALDENTVDPAVWGQNFPRQYDG